MLAEVISLSTHIAHTHVESEFGHYIAQTHVESHVEPAPQLVNHDFNVAHPVLITASTMLHRKS